MMFLKIIIKKLIVNFFKGLKILNFKLNEQINTAICAFLLYINNVEHKKIKSNGIPYIHISKNAICSIDSDLLLINGYKYSVSGLDGRCRIEVRDSARLVIGKNVGLSNVTIVSHNYISIGDNVMIGVGTQIFDTDFHSLDYTKRNANSDWDSKKTNPVKIGKNVFIGAYAIILKGVEIGEGAVIGAGSVVTRSIPENEIWAGNPARFIRNVINHNR